MIVAIEGKIEKKEPTLVHINVNGLVYEVFVSLNCSGAIIDSKVKLHTTQIIKEDSNSLYGFLDLNEKKLFDTVIKINGVGPKVAMAICSTFTPASFAQIVTNNDVSMLKRVPGIGPKGASRILVELSGFVVTSSANVSDETNNLNACAVEAAMALESLGFKKDQISKALANCTSTDTASLVKEALKNLQK
ncbi:MAG: Holliday junction branch migration protein RuvA [Campylobacterales bacterium]|nr:Holliday junction branch migration protein RuvA [Campylobacterales bacterium]